MNTKKIVIFISALALVIMLLLTAVSQAIFGNMGYLKKEFVKYSVTDNINMEMDDIMYMMNELMDYLHGDRDDLENIVVNVEGQPRDFFSDREKIHMADRKVLFDAGYNIRFICTIIFLAAALGLIITKRFDIRGFLKSAGLVSLIITAAALLVAVAASINFNACFVIFHKLFFSNDLWLLDPAEDLVINILVEPFFADMAIKIAIYCAFVLSVLIASGAGIYITDKKRRIQ